MRGDEQAEDREKTAVRGKWWQRGWARRATACMQGREQREGGEDQGRGERHDKPRKALALIQRGNPIIVRNDG